MKTAISIVTIILASLLLLGCINTGKSATLGQMNATINGETYNYDSPLLTFYMMDGDAASISLSTHRVYRTDTGPTLSVSLLVANFSQIKPDKYNSKTLPPLFESMDSVATNIPVDENRYFSDSSRNIGEFELEITSWPEQGGKAVGRFRGTLTDTRTTVSNKTINLNGEFEITLIKVQPGSN